jgi:cytochrome c
MAKRSGIIYTIIILFALVNLSYRKFFQENHSPTVKIITPVNKTVVTAGAPVSYRLSVADKEDGDSKFDEINIKEILLEVKYIGTKTEIPGSSSKNVQDDPPGLAVIRTSNCLNCHNFNSKSIGPSFFEISKRHPATKVNTDSLIRDIKNGSAGVWGKEKMPSHPELTPEEIKTSVQWILKNAAVQNINYYNGIAGVIQFPANKKGNYLLTASYTDHGIKNVSGKRLKGIDMVVVNVK